MNKYETNCITKTCKENKDRSTWIIKEKTHDPIIDKATYDKVQEIKLGRSGNRNRNVKYEFFLKDLLYCGECKRKLQYKIYKSIDKQKILYGSNKFNCSLLYKKNCNNKTSIKEKDLNEIVKSIVIKKFSLVKIYEMTNKLKLYYEDNDEKMKRLKEYNNQIDKLERKKKILYNKKCDNYITLEEFKKEYSKSKEEIEEYKILIKKLKKNSFAELKDFKMKEIIKEFQNGKYIDNNFLREIIDRIEIYSQNRIEIIFKYDI